jgi:fatty aldehyde decarbonylase
MIADEWRLIRDEFELAAEANDLSGCFIIQDLLIESLAIGLYSTFADPDNRDEATRVVAERLLRDERRHLDTGLRRIGQLARLDGARVSESLRRVHHRVAPLLFHMIRTACDFLCGRHGMNCQAEKAFVDAGALELDGSRTTTSFIDLNRLKVAAFQQYVEMLRRGPFEQSLVLELLGGMGDLDAGEVLVAGGGT